MSLGPMLLLSSAIIAKTKTYRPELWFAWAMITASMGALSILRPDSSLAHAIGFQVILGIGGGIFYGAVYFPILAALPVTENAHAVAFIAFGRQFAGVRPSRLFIRWFAVLTTPMCRSGASRSVLQSYRLSWASGCRKPSSPSSQTVSRWRTHS